MKQLLFILLFLPCAGFAQKKADYKRAMARFVKFYNHKQSDNIRQMWPPKDADSMGDMWGKEELETVHKECGKILSYKYVGIDKEDANPGLAVFKIELSIMGWKTLSMTLDKNKYLGTFRFITSSDGIDKLLKAEQ